MTVKWITIEGSHINTDTIATFYWEDGVLTMWRSNNAMLEWEDPDKKLYHMICRAVDLAPAV